MDQRHPPGAAPRPPPQRPVTVSTFAGSYAYQQGLRRPQQPSRLSNVRSVSHPALLADLTAFPAIPEQSLTPGAIQTPDKIYTSPEVIDLDEEDVERPAKRVKTEDDALKDGGEQDLKVAVDSAHRIVPGSPLPSLPKQTLPERTTARRSRGPGDRAARKANGLEPPAIATRLPPPKNVADFNPWKGDHPEDVLNENIIKNGYFDRGSGQSSMEYNSARLTIWPSMAQKNSIGLQMLSQLYAAVMEKRQHLGKCTTPSNFKPPPRVTITDSKREAWLRDLANPEVPLRKQSRNIPFGIRGKLLMEQCLSKDIPLPRAVWLAKCVGANELRAFRRKGFSGAAAASGEMKWIREWTSHVQSFLEGVIASCGTTPDWQSKMDYAVKLTANFYSERLVDRDFYLDWILQSFASAGNDILPIWVILVTLYWKDLVAHGRRGRKLAEAILEKLDQITQSPRAQTLEPLRQRLLRLLANLAATSRGCLVLPRLWQKYGYLLTPKEDQSVALPLATTAQNIKNRNERLMAPLYKTTENTRSAVLDLYTTLDSVDLDVDVAQLAAQITASGINPRKLVAHLLDWSATIYRRGLSRVYLTSRLLAHLREEAGIDTDAAILDYLRNADVSMLDTENVYRVITEMVDLGAFAAGKYMQWLLTSGIMNTTRKEFATGLLFAFAEAALPSHLAGTRLMLMRRLQAGGAGHGAMGLEEVKMKLREAWEDVKDGRIARSEETLVSLDGLCRLALGKSALADVVGDIQDGSIRAQKFCFLRAVHERCKDIRNLADLVQDTISTTDDAKLLATLSDTVTRHARSLAALGQLTPLCDALLARYRALRSSQLPERSLILALSRLVSPLSSFASQTKLLADDLAVCDTQSAIAVCSPASDSLVNMSAAHLDSDGDIDAVFASGNIMDEMLMQRVFARVADRCGKMSSSSASLPGSAESEIAVVVEDASLGTSKVASWLNQLRTLELAVFETLVKNYIKTAIAASEDVKTAQQLQKMTRALVASESMQMNTVVECLKKAATTRAAELALEFLRPGEGQQEMEMLTQAERYRCCVLRERWCAENAEVVTGLVLSALRESKTPDEIRDMGDIVAESALGNAKVDLHALAAASMDSPVFGTNFQILLTSLLHKNAASQPLDAEVVVQLATPLSVSICAELLALYALRSSGSDSDDTMALRIRNAVLDAIRNGSDVWPQLLLCSGPEALRNIYEWARDQVLAFATTATSMIQHDADERRRLLDILDVSYHASKEPDVAAVLSSIADGLKQIEAQLSASMIMVSEREELQQRLSLLLHLAVLYASSSSSVSAEDNGLSGENNANATPNISGTANGLGIPRRDHLLAMLCTILIHPTMQRHPVSLECVFDTAAFLANNVSEGAVAQIVRFLPPPLNNPSAAARDPRLAFVLGLTPPADGWIALAVHSPLNSTSSASVGGSVTSAGLGISSPAVSSQGQQQQQQQRMMGRPGATATPLSAQAQARQASQSGLPSKPPTTMPRSNEPREVKMQPFPLRTWEIVPAVGGGQENDTSLSLSLFAARRV